MDTISEPQKRKPGRPRKPRVAPDVSVSERQAEPQEALYQRDLDAAEKLIQRRLERGVFNHAAAQIEMVDERLEPHWFNEQINDQRIYQAISAGWIPVRPSMVRNLSQLGVYDVSPEGHIVRAQRGQEKLMCMTKANVAAIRRQKDIENARLMGSTQKTKDSLAETMARDVSAEAGEFVRSHVFGEVVDSKERIERLDPDDQLS